MQCHQKKRSSWSTTSWSLHFLLMTSDPILRIYVWTWKRPARWLNHTMTSWDANLCHQVLSIPLSWRFLPLWSSHKMLQGESDGGNHHRKGLWLFISEMESSTWKWVWLEKAVLSSDTQQSKASSACRFLTQFCNVLKMTRLFQISFCTLLFIDIPVKKGNISSRYC